MKTLKLCTATLIAGLIASNSLLAQEPGKPAAPTVVTSAAETVYVKPDGARILFSFTSLADPDRSAREVHENQVKKLRDALAALPLGKCEREVLVVPSSPSLLVAAHSGPTEEPPIFAKRAQSVFQVTIRDHDFDPLRDAVSRIVECAAEHRGRTSTESNQLGRSFRMPKLNLPGLAVNDEPPELVQGPTIEWMRYDVTQARKEAIRLAIRNARADAEAAMDAARLKLVQINLSEFDIGHQTRRMSSAIGAMGEPMQPVLVPVRVTATLTFAISP